MQIEAAGLRDVFAYWDKLRGARIAPARREIRPDQIPRAMLPSLFIIEVIAGPKQQFRYRLFGTEVTKEYGSDPTGKFAHEVDLDSIADRIIGIYETVAATAQPSIKKWRYAKSDGRVLDYESLILPLSDDGATVNFLLGAAVGTGVG